MVLSINPRETFEYVLPEDKDLPEEQRVTWILSGLSMLQWARVMDARTPGAMALLTLRMGLRGWRNFRDENGAEIPFELSRGQPRQVTDECLERVPLEVCMALSKQIQSRGEVSVSEGN